MRYTLYATRQNSQSKRTALQRKLKRHLSPYLYAGERCRVSGTALKAGVPVKDLHQLKDLTSCFAIVYDCGDGHYQVVTPRSLIDDVTDENKRHDLSKRQLCLFTEEKYYAFRSAFDNELSDSGPDDKLTQSARRDAQEIFFTHIIDHIQETFKETNTNEKLPVDAHRSRKEKKEAEIIEEAKRFSRQIVESLVVAHEKEEHTAFNNFVTRRVKNILKDEKPNLENKIKRLMRHGHFVDLLKKLEASSSVEGEVGEDLETVKLQLMHYFFRSLSPDYDVSDRYIARAIGASDGLWMALNSPQAQGVSIVAAQGGAQHLTTILTLAGLGVLLIVNAPILGWLSEKLYVRSALKEFSRRNHREPSEEELQLIKQDGRHLRNRVIGSVVGWSFVFSLFEVLKAASIFTPQTWPVYVGIALAVGFGAGFGASVAYWSNLKSKHSADEWQRLDKSTLYLQLSFVFLGNFISGATWYGLSLLAGPLGHLMGKGGSQLITGAQKPISDVAEKALEVAAGVLLGIFTGLVVHRVFKIVLQTAERARRFSDRHMNSPRTNLLRFFDPKPKPSAKELPQMPPAPPKENAKPSQRRPRSQSLIVRSESPACFSRIT